jgi:hypothetical protein
MMGAGGCIDKCGVVVDCSSVVDVSVVRGSLDALSPKQSSAGGTGLTIDG